MIIFNCQDQGIGHSTTAGVNKISAVKRDNYCMFEGHKGHTCIIHTNYIQHKCRQSSNNWLCVISPQANGYIIRRIRSVTSSSKIVAISCRRRLLTHHHLSSLIVLFQTCGYGYSFQRVIVYNQSDYNYTPTIQFQ